MIREIVRIDEDKCDGCGLCVPNCHEGAIKIINGKAKLITDALCDGLGACLGHCPQGAITIERRDAANFDEALVTKHLSGKSESAHPAPGAGASPHPAPVAPALPQTAPAPLPMQQQPMHAGGGCPGSRMRQFARTAPTSAPRTDASESAPSELTHWPVQLNLLPPHAPVLRGARLLIAADCVPVAYADFHSTLLRGRAVLIGCPKFDDLNGYVERLTEIIRQNELEEIVVARMEVPCCMGIALAVQEARKRAGVAVRIVDVVVSTQGELLAERELPLAG